MEVEKLIERLIAYAEKCDRLENGMGEDIMAAVTALSKLQAENEKLRAELEKESAARKRQADILCELRGQKYEQISAIDYLRVELKQKEKLVNQQANELERRDKLMKEQEAENVRLRKERDAAVSDLNEFLAMDELCPAQCKWCKWKDTFCDGKTPEWRGIKED